MILSERGRSPLCFLFLLLFAGGCSPSSSEEEAAPEAGESRTARPAESTPEPATLDVTFRVKASTRTEGPVLLTLKGPSGPKTYPARVEKPLTLAGLEPGDYTASARGERHRMFAGSPGFPLRPGERRPVEIVLRSMRVVTGSVRTTTGAALTEIDLDIDMLTQPETVPVSEGIFTWQIPDDDLPMTTTFRAVAPGHAYQKHQIALEPGKDLEGMRVVLGPGGTVTGSVRTDDGKPVTGALASYSSREHDGRVKLDESGDFSFSSIPYGRYIVAAQLQGYVSDNDVVEFTEKTPAHAVSLVLRRGLKVVGYVKSTEGEPIEKAHVYAMNAHTYTDSRGYFELTGIPPLRRGKVSLMHAEAPGYEDGFLRGVVPGNSVTFRLSGTPKKIRVPFYVRSFPQEHLGKLDVRFGLVTDPRSEDPPKTWTGVPASKRYAELPSGTYLVRVSAVGIMLCEIQNVIIGDTVKEHVTLPLDRVDAAKVIRAHELAAEVVALRLKMFDVTDQERPKLKAKAEKLEGEVEALRQELKKQKRIYK